MVLLCKSSLGSTFLYCRGKLCDCQDIPCTYCTYQQQIYHSLKIVWLVFDITVALPFFVIPSKTSAFWCVLDFISTFSNILNTKIMHAWSHFIVVPTNELEIVLTIQIITWIWWFFLLNTLWNIITRAKTNIPRRKKRESQRLADGNDNRNGNHFKCKSKEDRCA